MKSSTLVAVLVLSAAAAAQTPSVVGAASVVQLDATTQFPGGQPNRATVAAGTPIQPTVQAMPAFTGAQVARSMATFTTTPSAITLDVSSLAMATSIGAQCDYNATISVVFTSATPVPCFLELELLIQGDSGLSRETVGVDLDGDAVVDLVPAPRGFVQRVPLTVDQRRTVTFITSGAVDLPVGFLSLLSRTYRLRLVPEAPAGRLQQVLAPCSPLRLEATPTFTDAVELRAVSQQVGLRTNLSLLVLGFQPVFATLPLASGCFWLPSADITIALRSQDPVTVPAAGLAGVQFYAQAAVFVANPLPGADALEVSDGWRLRL